MRLEVGGKVIESHRGVGDAAAAEHRGIRGVAGIETLRIATPAHAREPLRARRAVATIGAENRTQGGGKITGVQIAAKTGTAEHGADPKATPPHNWYVAFAPANDPQIAVAVLVENGGDRSLEATGGSRAAPIGRAVIAAGLRSGR